MNPKERKNIIQPTRSRVPPYIYQKRPSGPREQEKRDVSEHQLDILNKKSAALMICATSPGNHPLDKFKNLKVVGKDA